MSKLPGLSCCVCGSDEIVSVLPGDEPGQHWAVGVFSRGSDPKAWCMVHAPWIKGHQPSLFETENNQN